MIGPFIPKHSSSFQQHKKRIETMILEGLHDGQAWKPESLARYTELEESEHAAALLQVPAEMIPPEYLFMCQSCLFTSLSKFTSCPRCLKSKGLYQYGRQP